MAHGLPWQWPVSYRTWAIEQNGIGRETFAAAEAQSGWHFPELGLSQQPQTSLSCTEAGSALSCFNPQAANEGRQRGPGGDTAAKNQMPTLILQIQEPHAHPCSSACQSSCLQVDVTQEPARKGQRPSAQHWNVPEGLTNSATSLFPIDTNYGAASTLKPDPQPLHGARSVSITNLKIR